MTTAVRAVLAMDLDPPVIPPFHYELFICAAREWLWLFFAVALFIYLLMIVNLAIV